VVHLSEKDPDKHRAVLRNVANLRADLGPDVPVELVVHGPALAVALRTSAEARQVTELVADGVAVAACQNTLRSLDMTAEALLPGVLVVPSGVGELARRQLSGWAYLRP
jgi:intracellular sulfur oxidation DsrE/DsrF family protein